MNDNKPNGKILKKFRDFVKSSFYIDKIIEIRKELEIPKDGYDINVQEDQFDNALELHASSKAYEIIDNFPVQNHYLTQLVTGHILYNQFLYEQLWTPESESEMCIVNSAEEQLQWLIYTSEAHLSKYVSREVLDQYLKVLIKGSSMYPTMIRMHEYATMTDLKRTVKNSKKLRDLISKNESLEHEYSLKNAKAVARKDKIARDDLIYKNLELSNKDLLIKLKKELNDSSLDEGSIGKIKSRQRKLRDRM